MKSWRTWRASIARYRVTVIGFHQMQLSNSREIEMRKLAFCLRGEIDKRHCAGSVARSSRKMDD
jgi:hypothetical protein